MISKSAGSRRNRIRAAGSREFDGLPPQPTNLAYLFRYSPHTNHLEVNERLSQLGILKIGAADDVNDQEVQAVIGTAADWVTPSRAVARRNRS